MLTNNDCVLLESKDLFRLTYTAKCPPMPTNSFVVIEDNLGLTPWEQTFEFNSKDLAMITGAV